MPTSDIRGESLARLAAEIRDAGWELSLAVVEDGLTDDAIPSLQRLGRLGQLGDLPTFIAELSHELEEPTLGRLRPGGALSKLVRDHAREREALGFAPREIVTELLLLRRALWQFVSGQRRWLNGDGLAVLEQRLNATVDRLVTECVVAYFDRATSELAHQARHDTLTELLNHQAFTRKLELELERAQRYTRGTALIFFDLDDFKQVNDTFGHPEGDRVLRVVSSLLRSVLRATDVAGRMGGDEFAALLVEADSEVGGSLVARLHDGLDELVAGGDLPEGLRLSAGVAHFPTEALSLDDLVRLADSRLYEEKRSKA